MNPHQKNKVDVKSLSPEEQRLFRLYGKLPSRSDHFAKHLKERKYFDSGDYAMSKAGRGDGVDAGAVGSEHPVPENIPHLSSPIQNASNNGGNPNAAVQPGLPGSGTGATTAGVGGVVPKHAHHGSVPGIQAGSPIKESSMLQRETSADDQEDGETPKAEAERGEQASATTDGGAIPIRG